MFLAIWILLVFAIGAAIGSFLNVCIYRLPLEKSVLWPGSRCGSCLKPIRMRDNIPVLSYWLLGGRCRMCGAEFSMQYFWVELLTGLAFAGLFYLEVVVNIHGFGLLAREAFNIEQGVIPWQGWVIFGHHAILLSLLIVAAGCDLMHREIPLSVTLPGTAIGLLGATLWPWPWPYDASQALPMTAVAFPGQVQPVAANPWWLLAPHQGPDMGLYAWPFWGPLPLGLEPGTWQLGLLTGLVGMLVGTMMLRGIRTLFSMGVGAEALGLGDADLMMMAGAFLGWQPVFVGFFIGVFPAMIAGIIQRFRTGDNALAFVPWLALGVIVSWLCWSTIGPVVQVLLFYPELMLFMIVASAVMMVVSAYMIRGMRWLRG
ncbi:MAG: prepilin peptidase [Gemmataceae bacterium]|nr:prepilin peptidase [Gemmataceae bacterium]